MVNTIVFGHIIILFIIIIISAIIVVETSNFYMLQSRMRVSGWPRLGDLGSFFKVAEPFEEHFYIF